MVFRKEKPVRKRSLVEKFGTLPAGFSAADADAVLQFLYGAFDRKEAKQVKILHPYWEEVDGQGEPPELTIDEFSRWLQTAVA